MFGGLLVLGQHVIHMLSREGHRQRHLPPVIGDLLHQTDGLPALHQSVPREQVTTQLLTLTSWNLGTINLTHHQDED